MMKREMRAAAYLNHGGRQSVDVYLAVTSNSPEQRTVQFVQQLDDSFDFVGITAVDVTYRDLVDLGPAFRLSCEEAQALMDSLWNCGLRPVGAAGSVGQLEAVKYHLEDMRKMVFERLEYKRKAR